MQKLIFFIFATIWLSATIFVFWFLVRTILSGIKISRNARISDIEGKYLRASRERREWLNDHPFYDNSHFEAQKLLRKEINAYGARLRVRKIKDGELHLKELINQLDRSSSVKTDT